MAFKLQFKQVDSAFVSYYIYRETSPRDMIALAEANTINPINLTSLTLNSEGVGEYVDTTAPAGVTHYYMLRCISGDGLLTAGQSAYSNITPYEGGTGQSLVENIPIVMGTDHLAWWTSLDPSSFTKLGGGQPDATASAGVTGEELVTWSDQLSTPLTWNVANAGTTNPKLTSDGVRHIVSTHTRGLASGVNEPIGWVLTGLGSDEIGTTECCFFFGMPRAVTFNPQLSESSVILLQIINTLTTEILRLGADASQLSWVFGRVSRIQMWARRDGAGVITETEVRSPNLTDQPTLGELTICFHVDWKLGKIRPYFMNQNRELYACVPHDVEGGKGDPVAPLNGGVGLGTFVPLTTAAPNPTNWAMGIQEMIILQKPNITIDEITYGLNFIQSRMELGWGGNFDGLPLQFSHLPLTNDYSSTGDITYAPNDLDAIPFTEDGYQGQGHSLFVDATVLPAWLTDPDEPLYIQATIGANNNLPYNPSFFPRQAIIEIGDNNHEDDKLAIYQAEIDGATGIVLGKSGGTSNDYTPLFRKGWEYKANAPLKSSDKGWLDNGNYQGIAFQDVNNLFTSVVYNGIVQIDQLDPATFKVNGSFQFDTLSPTELNSMSFDSSGDLWAISGTTLYKLDLTASLLAGDATVTITHTISGLVNPQAIEFTDVSGTEYLILGDFDSGSAFVYFIDIANITDGGTFTIGGEFKRFNIGSRVQGICVDNSNELRVMKIDPDQSTSPSLGLMHSYGDVDTLLTGTTTGATLTADSIEIAACARCQDLTAPPIGGGVWTICDGYLTSEDLDGWRGSIWYAPLDGSVVQNTVGIFTTGNHNDTENEIYEIYLNGKLFRSFSDSFAALPSINSLRIGAGFGANLSAYDDRMFLGTIKDVFISPNVPEEFETALDTTTSIVANIPLTLPNPDAESGTTGWVNDLGSIELRNSDPAPMFGTQYFSGGVNAETIARQRIDLLATSGLTGTQIDNLAGTDDIWLRLEWWQTHFDGSDTGQMGLRTLDGSFVQIDERLSLLGSHTYSQIGVSVARVWRKYATTILVASGTRHVDVVFRGVLNSGSIINYHVDNITLNLLHN